MSDTNRIDSYGPAEDGGILINTEGGHQIQIQVTYDHGAERVTVAGVTCDLDGQTPGTYYLM